MGEWKTICISDLGRIVTGKTPKTSIPQNYGGEIPFLTPSDNLDYKTVLTTAKTLSELGVEEVRNCLLPANSICVSCIGSDLGKVVMTDRETITNQQFNSIIPNKKYSPDFIYYLMTIVGKELNFLSKTSTAIPIINKTTFSNFEVYVPDDLSTQRRIAGILGSLDDKIELNRRINANLEAQAQALFRSWFVDFEPFRDGPFVDSELGKIPQGWKVGMLSNFAKVIKKGITPSNSEIYSHYSIPAYDDAQFPEKQSGETIKSGKYIVYNNSVLLSKLNPRIKRLWFIKTAEKNAICSTEFIPIQPENKDLISFVFYLIDSDNFYQQALSLVNGATGSHQRFHAEDIMQIPFAWNEDIALDFAQKTNCILQKIEDNIKENQALSVLRDTLLPKLMAGEIKIN